MALTITFLHIPLLHGAKAYRLNGMCNDFETIKSLGGATKVANDFGFGVQQVHNWMTRGIPAGVILDNPKFYDALVECGYERVLRTREAA